MLSFFGNSLILISILASALIILKSILILNNKASLISVDINNLITLQTSIIIISFLTLVSAFIISDFSLITVYQNSHTLKPLIYKIAGTWGNHEGSLLMWIVLMSIFSFLFFIKKNRYKREYYLFTLIAQTSLILLFLIFLIFSSNPFSKIFPEPMEGLGLNPILQDPALAIHPPLLYVGFVGSSIYFSAAIGALMSNVDGADFAKSIKNWIKITWFFQTIGILAGSIWAYYELGWGGFWFWDPVENASLLPWFCMTALLHSVIVLEKKKQLFSWVLVLCLMTFCLTIAGTFLVRSGVLNSVHTFANDPQRGLFILIILSLTLVTSFGVYFLKNKENNYNNSGINRETFIVTNNWFMMFYLLTVFLGTVYPIFTEVISDIKVSVGPPFYNTVIIPFVVIFLLFMGIGPNSKWGGKFINLKRFFLVLSAAVFINIILIYFLNTKSILFNLIFVSSLFLIFYTIIDLIKSIRSKSSFRTSRICSHLGFGLLVLFIGLNENFSKEFDINLKPGETKKIDNYEIIFDDLLFYKQSNYNVVAGNFTVMNNKSNDLKRFKPEIRIYKNPETLTFEASIKTNLLSDQYLTMSNIQSSDYYNIKFQEKPLMIWIWVSVIIMSLGGITRFYRSENNL